MIFSVYAGLLTVAAGLSAASAPVSPTPAAPGASVLAVDMAGDRLLVIDPEAGRVRAEVPTGKGPHEVAVSADGKLAFVSIYGGQGGPGHELAVIDVAAGKELRRVDLAPFAMPHGLAVVDGKVYFTAEANRAVGRYDPKADRVDRIVGLGQDGTHMIVASPDGRMLYTANIGSGTVCAVDRQAGKLARIEVGGHPEGLAVSPDGREVWAGEREGGRVSVIDAGTRAVVARVETGAKMAARLRFTPDGRRVLLPDPHRGRLLVIDAKERAVERSVEVGQGPLGALVEPGGKRAFVPLAGEGRVAVVDLESWKVVAAIETGPVADGMAWAGGPAAPASS